MEVGVHVSTTQPVSESDVPEKVDLAAAKKLLGDKWEDSIWTKNEDGGTISKDKMLKVLSDKGLLKGGAPAEVRMER